MARLKDIAARTGLSVNTVSLALRESPRIPAATRERVREAASALDYLPNHAAQALVSRRTSTVGLLLTDITSPLLTQVARAVEMELKALGYVTLLTASNGDPEEELRALDTFRARRVDGMLVYPHRHDRLEPLRRLREAGMPVVLLAGDADGAVDVVRIDEHDGAYRATRHLIESGHRRIGIVDGAHLNGNPAKLEGLADALRDAGLGLPPDLVVNPEGESVRHGHGAFARLTGLPEPPTAVLTANDRLALGGLRWCQEAGLAVPDDLAIFGYDDVEYGEFASIPLSSVNYPAGELARRALARLTALMGHEGRLPRAETVRIKPALVLRASTGTRR